MESIMSTIKEQKIAKIKSKIKALLEKTVDNGATEAEMLASLAKANELMAEHFITLHDVNEAFVAEKCISKSTPMVRSRYDFTLYIGQLGKSFDCESWWNTGSKTVTFFGYEQDVDMCIYFYRLIARATFTAKDEYIKSAECRTLLAGLDCSIKSLSSSFIKGFLFSVTKKLQELYAQKQSNIPQSYGLIVVAKEDAVKEQYNALDMKVRQVKSNFQVADMMSATAGMEAGEQFQLTQGLNGDVSQPTYIS
jgi:hypothetical protein